MSAHFVSNTSGQNTKIAIIANWHRNYIDWIYERFQAISCVVLIIGNSLRCVYKSSN